MNTVKYTRISNRGVLVEFTYSKRDEQIAKGYKWYISVKGYPETVDKRKPLRFSRVVMRASKGEVVDHIDGNTLNNTRQNLRKCSVGENNMNQLVRSGGSSKYKGVYLYKPTKKWCAQIQFKNKKYALGYYCLEDEAAKAYNKKAKELFGDFAKLNTII